MKEFIASIWANLNGYLLERSGHHPRAEEQRPCAYGRGECLRDPYGHSRAGAVRGCARTGAAGCGAERVRSGRLFTAF